MLSLDYFFVALAVMAGVTYMIRALPFALCRKEVENQFIKSFLAYVPYAVLGAMTFPAIIYSADNIPAGLAGTVAALVFAYRRKSLLTVALVACGAAFVVLSGLFWLSAAYR